MKASPVSPPLPRGYERAKWRKIVIIYEHKRNATAHYFDCPSYLTS